MDEILLNKKTSIERCIKRIKEDFADDFISNYTKQDAVILNIERACQAAIDMGNRILNKLRYFWDVIREEIIVKWMQNGGAIKAFQFKRMRYCVYGSQF